MMENVSHIEHATHVASLNVSAWSPTALTDVGQVRTRGVDCFATLRQEMLASATHAAKDSTVVSTSRAARAVSYASSTVAVGESGHVDRKPFTDAASQILPPEAVREICLRHVAQRTAHQTDHRRSRIDSIADERSLQRSSRVSSPSRGTRSLSIAAAASSPPIHIPRTRRELRRIFRSAVVAVVFSNVITHMRLKRITKDIESHRCEPYHVLPCAAELETTIGRTVCVFAAQQMMQPDLLFFALDRSPHPTAGWAWSVFPVRRQAIRAMESHFLASVSNIPRLSTVGGDGDDAAVGQYHQAASLNKPRHIRLCDVIVISEYDANQRTLVPLNVEHISGRSNMYLQILHDFESRVNHMSTTAAVDDVAEPNVFSDPMYSAEVKVQPQPSLIGNGSMCSNSTRRATTASLPATPMTQLLEPPTSAASTSTPVNVLDIPLPTFQELAVMPDEIGVAVRQIALAVLRRCLLPRVLLRQRKRLRERMSRAATAFPLTVEHIQKLPTFEMWPPSLIDELISKLHPYTADRGEILLQERENPCNAMYLLTSGTVQQIQKVDPASKRLSGGNVRVLQPAISAVTCFGQLSFISDDPRLTTVRANSLATFWRIFRPDYFQVFSKLPPSVRTHVTDLAFQRRTSSIPYNAPLTVHILQQMPVFSTCGESALRALLPLFRPVAVPPMFVLSAADGDGSVMYLLLRGRCGIFRSVRGDRGVKEDAHVHTICPPAMVGDDAVVGGGSHVATVKSLTSCDLYMLTKEDFESCMSRFGSEWNAVVEQATNARHLRLLDSQDRFKAMALHIPIVSQVLAMPDRVELSRCFKPILYHPKQTVCCSAHFADRVIIVVEGTVRFQDGKMWECGEAAGYSCIVPHRWAQTATAMTSSKLIELRHDVYRRFLHERGLLQRVRHAIEALMFPKACDPHLVYWSLVATQTLRNPPLYPVSDCDRVNPCEERFGLQVTTLGQQKVHRRAQKHEASPLEREVHASLANIDARERRRHIARNYTPSPSVPRLAEAYAHTNGIRPQSALAGSSSASPVAALHRRSASPSPTVLSWSKSRLLLMKSKDDDLNRPIVGGVDAATHHHQQSSSSGTASRMSSRPVPNVDHHPVMRQYLETRRRPVAFRRLPYATTVTSASGLSMMPSVSITPREVMT